MVFGESSGFVEKVRLNFPGQPPSILPFPLPLSPFPSPLIGVLLHFDLYRFNLLVQKDLSQEEFSGL